MNNCSQAQKLRREWKAAAARFEVARAKLNSRIGTSSKDEFQALQAEADQCWAAVDVARTTLHDHIRQHACGVHDSAEASPTDINSKGIWVINSSAKTLYANERMAEILGLSSSELMGRDSFEFVFAQDRDAAQTLFATKTRGDSNPFLFRLRRYDGSEIWVHVQGTPMKDASGRFTGIVGTFTVIDQPVD